jgi:serine/threonine protein kinase
VLAFAEMGEYAAGVSSVGPALELTPPVTPAALLEPARYLLGEHLAQGGMAALFLGRRVAIAGIERPVVLKRLRPELSNHGEARALFLREAKLLSLLDHPGIVRCLDLTEIDGVPYLVLEYVRGGDLRLLLRRVRRRGLRFGVAASLYMARELCCALDHAHRLCLADGRPLHLVHRDVSPNNILLSIHGEVKLSDFGITQAAEPFGHGPQARGQIGYMSPEQARHELVDARADVFSLATVLYELLTDRRLFVGQVGQSAAEVYGETVEAPSLHTPGLPADLDALLLRALSLSPSQRPVSARAFYLDLHELCRTHDLRMDRAEFASVLCDLCGPDPAQWATLEERTKTAVISPIGILADGSGPSHTAPILPLATDELSGSLITVPWPTVGGLVDGLSEGDSEEDTLTWRSRAQIRSSPRVIDARRLVLRTSTDCDPDPEAVTKPAERTAPEEALPYDADAPSLLLPHAGTGRLPLAPPGNKARPPEKSPARRSRAPVARHPSPVLWLIVLGLPVLLLLLLWRWRGSLGF